MMNEEQFNSWAADIANDYAQAMQEMGPDDYESWEVYSHRRMQQNDEAEAYVMSQPSTPATSTYVAPDVDVDDLPF
jgi:hypothetical protein